MAGNSSKIRVQIERCGIEKEYLLGNIQSDLRYMHFADRNLFEFAVRDEKKQNWDRKEAHIWNER